MKKKDLNNNIFISFIMRKTEAFYFTSLVGLTLFGTYLLTKGDEFGFIVLIIVFIMALTKKGIVG